MRYLVLFILLTPLFFEGKAQTVLKDNQYQYKLYNGLDVYLLEEKADPLITFSLTFQTGVVADEDTLHGISYQAYKVVSKSLRTWAQAHNITYLDSFKSDRTTHIFQFPPAALNKTLQDFAAQLLLPIPINPSDLATAIPMASVTDSIPPNITEKATKLLWGGFYLRTTLHVDSLTIDTALIRKVVDNYYCGSNAIAIIRGNFVNRSLFPIIQATLINLNRCSHSPFLQNPIPDPKDINYSTQLVEVNALYNTPKFVRWARGATALHDRENFLTTQLMEETFRQASMSKAFLDTSYITSLKLQFESSRFVSTIKITMVPNEARVDPAYHNLARYFQVAAEGKIFNAADIDKAKSILLERLSNADKNPIANVNAMSNFWTNTSLNDYYLYEKRIKSITAKQLYAFISKYLQNQPSITSLFISQAKKDSLKTDTFFTGTYPIKEYKIFFDKNNAIVADSAKDSTIRSLAQAIKINPHLRVMINGVSAKNEYNYIYDNDVLSFLSQHAGFTIVPDDLIPIGPRRIRMDVYRALKVVKLLIEMGVPENQIQGTGKVVATGSMAPESDYQTFCTVTIY